MIKKLNNKGITVVEILICFSIISVIVVSMFKTISNYKNKQDIESYKNEVITYKNTVTKAIMDNIISETNKNGSIKDLSIDEATGTIRFNTIDSGDGNSGSAISINKEEGNINYNPDCYGRGEPKNEIFKIPDIPNLEFNEVIIKQTDENFLIVKVGFSHPDLGNGYDALNLVIPISK